MKRFRIIELVGWSGSFFLISAYLLNSAKLLASDSLWYQLMNLFGAGILGFLAYRVRAWPLFAVELFWCLIALASLFGVF